jgi:hypothetical protein
MTIACSIGSFLGLTFRAFSVDDLRVLLPLVYAFLTPLMAAVISFYYRR